ncbi:MAG: radical SAM family heme chaperone HemW [Actinomycetota bacterium]|nr:radical SAM family heme chaperone HemW [Actinomycetota bacterium]
MSVAAGNEQRSGQWLAQPGFGVYVHIPFCLRRCHYCDFNAYQHQDELYVPYVDALVRDIQRWEGAARPASSVFFGGGTPTVLDAPSLGRILRAVRERIGIAAGAEITVEANPETVDAHFFEALLKQGFNRVSIGVQSLVPGVLERLGRTHSAERAFQALSDARRAGVADLNADLIYGSPWERPADWRASLDGVIDAGPDHVSAYALTVEEGTPLARLVATGKVVDVDPDLQADRYEWAQERLAAAGYQRYEISNWARPGRASRHNVLYWSAGDYLGFGAGAHGHLSGRRWWSLRLPREYIGAVRRGESTLEGSERLDADERAAEALVLGLRLASGIDVSEFASRFGPRALDSRAPQIASLERDGLVAASAGRLRLTDRGTALANDVAARLL